MTMQKISQTWLCAAALLLAGGVMAQAPAAPKKTANDFEGSVTLGAKYVDVDGDEARWREHHWQRDGFTGGLESFNLRLANASGVLTVEGSAIALENEYSLTLGYQPNKPGASLKVWFEQYRKYFDDTGAYYSRFNPTSFDQGDDLYMTLGTVGVEVAFAADDFPSLSLSYVYGYKGGSKSLLWYYTVQQPQPPAAGHAVGTTTPVSQAHSTSPSQHPILVTSVHEGAVAQCPSEVQI